MNNIAKRAKTMTINLVSIIVQNILYTEKFLRSSISLHDQNSNKRAGMNASQYTINL